MFYCLLINLMYPYWKKDVLIPNLMVVYIFNDLFKIDGDLLLVMLFINSKNILCVSGK